MKPGRIIGRIVAGLKIAVSLPAQEGLERLGERLSFSLADGDVQVTINGSLDLEGYAMSDPVADLVSGRKDVFLEPRLTLYLDAQAGRRAYVFGQVKVDRGFDVFTVEDETEFRLDEGALLERTAVVVISEMGRTPKLNRCWRSVRKRRPLCTPAINRSCSRAFLFRTLVQRITYDCVA